MKIARLTPDQKLLRRRIIEVSYQNGLSHLGSNLSAVDLVYAAYAVKGRRGRFVLSNGHAGLALYVVLERRGILEGSTLSGLSIHPDRDPALGISVSTGSLGQGLVIALGMALADRSRTVYCVASDGECAEGSVWEALRIGREQKVENLTIIINANGWAAYQPVPIEPLARQFGGFGYRPIRVDGHDVKVLMRTLPTRSKAGPRVIFARTTAEQFPFLRGQDAHYYTMSEADYRLATTMLA